MTVRHISDDMSKRINTVSISIFFKKRPKQSYVTSTSQPEPEATQEDRNPPGPSQTATAPTHSSSAAVSTANENPIYDISQVLNRQTISTADKHFILTHSRHFKADKTGDISQSEQLSICIRYFFDGKIREEFVSFTELTEFEFIKMQKNLLEKSK